MNKELTKQDNIIQLWSKINYKTGFIKEAAVHFKKSPVTLHNHWFAKFFTVPKKEEDNVIKFMQKYIKLQNEK